MVPTIIIIIGFIYGQATHEANQDSTIGHNSTKIEEVCIEQNCIKGDVQYLKEQAAIQREFYKLMRPDLWEEAEEIVNNNDST